MIEIKDIEKLAELSRLEIAPEEKEAMTKDLGSILTYIGQIKEAHVHMDASTMEDPSVRDGALVRNVLRDDNNTHESGAFTDVLMAEVPQTQDGYVKVKKIL